MDTYQPLAKKVISNLNVVSEMKYDLNTLQRECRAKLFNYRVSV